MNDEYLELLEQSYNALCAYQDDIECGSISQSLSDIKALNERIFEALKRGVSNDYDVITSR